MKGTINRVSTRAYNIPETKFTMTQINLKEKVGYAFGDFASSLFWKIFSMYLMIFYTDVFGISPASVGLMFLLTRIWDGANDPFMGIIADRTNTKQGKFRPYLLWVAVPFAIIGVLTFTTPSFGESGKLVYAYITYTLMMMVYTAINVPYSSLMGVMTDDSSERTSLASFRFIGAYSGGILLTASMPYLLDFFGSMQLPETKSYQYTVAIYAAIAAFFFIMTYLWTKERITPKNEQSSVKEDLKDLGNNMQWFIMLGAGIAVLIFNSLRDGSIMYYFKYFIKDQNLPWFGEVTYGKLAGAYMTLWLMTNLIGVLLAKPISDKVGKKKTFFWAMIVSSAFSVVMYWLKADEIALIFGLNVFIGISAGIVLPLVWSMYADIADYSEHRTGRRATGLIFSSSSMSQKMGGALGAFVTGLILSAFGFEANAEQTEQSILGIRLLISIFPAIGALLAVVFLWGYKLNDDYMEKITTELEEMRKK